MYQGWVAHQLAKMQVRLERLYPSSSRGCHQKLGSFRFAKCNGTITIQISLLKISHLLHKSGFAKDTRIFDQNTRPGAQLTFHECWPSSRPYRTSTEDLDFIASGYLHLNILGIGFILHILSHDSYVSTNLIGDAGLVLFTEILVDIYPFDNRLIIHLDRA